jgi:hypothetical protein
MNRPAPHACVRPLSTTSEAVRGRRHRALRRRHKAAYYVRAHEWRLAAALIKSGMPPEETECRAKIEAALDGLVEEWITRKLREP